MNNEISSCTKKDNYQFVQADCTGTTANAAANGASFTAANTCVRLDWFDDQTDNSEITGRYTGGCAPGAVTKGGEIVTLMTEYVTYYGDGSALAANPGSGSYQTGIITNFDKMKDKELEILQGIQGHISVLDNVTNAMTNMIDNLQGLASGEFLDLFDCKIL